MTVRMRIVRKRFQSIGVVVLKKTDCNVVFLVGGAEVWRHVTFKVSHTLRYFVRYILKNRVWRIAAAAVGHCYFFFYTCIKKKLSVV